MVEICKCLSRNLIRLPPVPFKIVAEFRSVCLLLEMSYISNTAGGMDVVPASRNLVHPVNSLITSWYFCANEKQFRRRQAHLIRIKTIFCTLSIKSSFMETDMLKIRSESV